MIITDNSGNLLVEVPSEWSDTNGDVWILNDEEIGYAVSASSDRDAYNNTWTTPGMFFGASTSMATQHTVASFLDTIDFSSECDYDGRFDYTDTLYTGVYDTYSNCGGEGGRFTNLVVTPATGGVLLLVQGLLVSDADTDAFNRILKSFTYTGP